MDRFEFVLQGGGTVSCDLRSNVPVLVTERIKVLRVIGEAVAQIVVESEVPIKAIKIDHITATLVRVEDRVFENKVVKQGFVHKQVFFVDPDNFVRHMAEDIPFMVAVDIPGVHPGEDVDVQNHLIDIDTNFRLIFSDDDHANALKGDNKGDHKAVLSQKVVAHVQVKVSEETQIDVVTDLHFPVVQRSSCNFSAF